ncbi:MAG: serine/threonine-protein kinase [Deltaproteobacteria bacterium]|jgi:serine/threonine protein kinase|nr:serine/threonine-protein kinase [Deltaproteobacteria bacterium]
MNVDFDKYEIKQKVASGGMAEIYQAILHGVKGFKKTLALKVIRPQLLCDPEFVEMFIKEATLAARLEHPNLVRVYEFDQVDSIYYIVMEFIKGIDLRQGINSENKFSDPEIVFYIARKVLQGLAYAHNLKDEAGNNLELIHRDISPHNILLSVNGEVKLGDFGIAKVKNAVSFTKSNMVRGKLHYLSPEQARGYDVLTPKSDIFSLGLVLWEMLSGKKRYDTKVKKDIFTEIMRGEFIPPENDRIDPAGLALLHCFLATDPAERFASAFEAVKEIKKIYPEDKSEELAQLVQHRQAKDQVSAQEVSIYQKDTRQITQSRVQVDDSAQKTFNLSLNPENSDKSKSLNPLQLIPTSKITALQKEFFLARHGEVIKEKPNNKELEQIVPSQKKLWKKIMVGSVGGRFWKSSFLAMVLIFIFGWAVYFFSEFERKENHQELKDFFGGAEISHSDSSGHKHETGTDLSSEMDFSETNSGKKAIYVIKGKKQKTVKNENQEEKTDKGRSKNQIIFRNNKDDSRWKEVGKKVEKLSKNLSETKPVSISAAPSRIIVIKAKSENKISENLHSEKKRKNKNSIKRSENDSQNPGLKSVKGWD